MAKEGRGLKFETPLYKRDRDRLRAQVVRLEAAIRAKDAALRAECSLDCEGHSRDCNVTKAQDDALSPDAGKGWLPPEVRERIWHDLGEPAACYHVLTRHPGPFCECEYPVCVLARAALAALKGVE